MDRPERAQAPGDASRRQSTPGATPEPGQAAFRGRQVAEVPGAGSSPSRTEPHATQATTGVSRSPHASVTREIGRVGSRFQPYSTGKPGRQPGTSRLPTGEPSVPPVPQGGRREPKPPDHFIWNVVYDNIMACRDIDAERGDIYAVAASDSALCAISQAVMGAYSTHPLEKLPNVERPDISGRLRTLRNILANAKCRLNRPKAEALERSLDNVYRVTHARDTELTLRRAEFQSASLPRVIAVPGREALERWLRTQASAAGTVIERSYFTRLAEELPSERDPWMVSRELARSLPDPGNAEQVQRLQDAHRRLVRAIACGLSEQHTEPGGPELPSRFKWYTVYEKIRVRKVWDAWGADIYAAAASAAALLDIDRAVRYAHFTHRMRGSSFQPFNMLNNVERLRTMLKGARCRANLDRVEAIQRSLDYICRLTHARYEELDRRSDEFRSASHPPGAPVPGREALERWLQAQADAAPGTGIERSYFTRLAEELRVGRDPWMVSQELARSLPGLDNAEDAARLQAAHRRLVQAMAGNLPPPAAVAAPDIAQAFGESRAPVSMQ